MLQIIDWSTSSFPLFYDDVCLSDIFIVEHDSGGGSGFYFTLILTESALYFTFASVAVTKVVSTRLCNDSTPQTACLRQ